MRLNFNIIKNLFLTNLVYINPIQTSKYRKKYKGTTDIRKKIFKNFCLINLLQIFIIIIIFGNPFTSRILYGPSYKYLILYFIFIATLTLSTSFLNMFYESKDTLSLLPLPISERELFLGKFLVLIFQLSGIILPLIVTNFIIGLYSSFSLIKVVVILVYSLSLVTLIIGLLMFLLSLVTYIPNFEKNKNKLNGFLILSGFILGFLFFYATNLFIDKNASTSPGNYNGDFLFNILTQDISTTYTNLGILIVLSLIIIFLVNKFVAAKYIKDIYRISSGVRQKKLAKNKKDSSSLKFKLIKRNIKLFSNGTLLSNIFMGNLIGVIFLAGPIIQIRKSDSLALGLEFFPVAICFGFFMAVLMMSSPITFSSVAISLEKQGYYQLKSLPLDFKKYLKIKLIISSILQITLALAILTIILIFAKIPIPFSMITIITFIFTGMAVSFLGFSNDFKKLHLTWHNIQELSTRGSNKVITGLIAFILFIAILLLIAVTYFIIMRYPIFTIIFGVTYTLIILAIFIICSIRVKKIVFDKIF